MYHYLIRMSKTVSEQKTILMIFFTSLTDSQLKNLSAESDVDALWPIYKVWFVINRSNWRLLTFVFSSRIFQTEFNKNYSDEEDKVRFEIFKETCKLIVEHNKKFEAGEVTWTMGINQFADKRQNEICCGGVRRDQPQQ